MTKKVIYIFLLMLSFQNVKGQIEPDLLLGLKRGSTAEINAISGAEEGALVYNTNDSSVYQYTGASWVRIFDAANNGTSGSKVNFGGRWTNTDTTTNINVTNTLAPIFGSEDYKDDGNLLYEVVGNTLIIKETGRYDIKVNLSFRVISSARNNPNARIAVNGVQLSARSATGYIRNASGHTQSSLHINETLNLNANDVISVIMTREGAGGVVNFNAANDCSFIINKLK